MKKGRLSSESLNLPNSSDALIAAGFRLTDGTCDDNIYPPNSSYAYAKVLDDYDHLNTEIQNTIIVIRRGVQNTHHYTTADCYEHQVFALVYIVVLLI